MLDLRQEMSENESVAIGPRTKGARVFEIGKLGAFSKDRRTGGVYKFTYYDLTETEGFRAGKPLVITERSVFRANDLAERLLTSGKARKVRGYR